MLQIIPPPRESQGTPGSLPLQLIRFGSVSMDNLRSIPSDRPVKRLRLGTKSCLECRRRKVSCIFEPNTTVCKRCFAHGSDCIPQKPAYSTNNAPAADIRDMQQKLQGLEAMVRQLYDVLKEKPTSLNGEPLNINALTTLQSSSSQEATPVTTASWGEA